jgi:hypothetical protein
MLTTGCRAYFSIYDSPDNQLRRAVELASEALVETPKTVMSITGWPTGRYQELAETISVCRGYLAIRARDKDEVEGPSPF